MHQKVSDTLPIKLIKLKNGEDLVSYVISETDTQITLKHPLVFTIENDIALGRQMLNVREWIASIVGIADSVEIDKSYVLYVMNVKDSFIDEYKEISSYLYAVTSKKSKKSTSDSGTKVVPFLVKDSGDKPH